MLKFLSYLSDKVKGILLAAIGTILLLYVLGLIERGISTILIIISVAMIMYGIFLTGYLGQWLGNKENNRPH